MPTLNLKPHHKVVTTYYTALDEYRHQRATHETAVRAAFQTLLETCARQVKWTLICEQTLRVPGRNPIRLDGMLFDRHRLPRGTWEAKGVHGNLRAEIQTKFDADYPQDNILFQTPERAILYQNGKEVLDADITDPGTLVSVLQLFFSYERENAAKWEAAVAEFKTLVPELEREVASLIRTQHETNPQFRNAFADFHQLCQTAINPNLSEAAVEKMLVQHLLTERTFRTVFNNPDFTRRNIIAREIEKVIDALAAQAFSRGEFLQSLDRFYREIEREAATLVDFSQKQHFLNTVYEQFFQGASADVADTHGIVYTPQPIVDFMVKSVNHLLQTEFGRSLSDEGVHIIDPFVGTGNFIVRLMREIDTFKLEAKYRSELWCNEVLLLPYYIASLNIEHEFYRATNTYLPFEGISLVDTFDLAEDRQLSLLTAENTARVEKQKTAPMFVIIGNPPYNVGQQNANDNNRNRKYPAMDKRLRDTYALDSKASAKNTLYDAYVKSIRWASDRIGKSGIVALVTNNGFLDAKAFDGMRKHLATDFDEIYILDLGGNARRGKLVSDASVFGIQVGVSINFFVKGPSSTVARGPVPRDRGTARDRPSPYGNGDNPVPRDRNAEEPLSTVARGPVPRDRDMARDRPSPYGNGDNPVPRDRNAEEPLSTVARGPVPRDRDMARDRPSPYGDDGDSLANRSAGACPPRSFNGEGNSARIFYYRTDDEWNKDRKFAFLAQAENLGNIPWQTLTPDERHTWLTEGLRDEWTTFIPIGSKSAKRTKGQAEGVIFHSFSLGVTTSRDAWVYNFNPQTLTEKLTEMLNFYHAEEGKWKRRPVQDVDVDNFVNTDGTKIKWSTKLKSALEKGMPIEFAPENIRTTLYRPFTKSTLYFGRTLNERVGRFPSIFPTLDTERENQVIWLKTGQDWPMFALMTNKICDSMPQSGSQCFPFYIYDEDGTNRRENITDWALQNFRTHYGDDTITKWDIFHYNYAVLHHPEYRERYAADMKRDLPHIPYAEDFWAFANAGAQLAELHVNYETSPQYPLNFITKPDAPLDLRVERMRLSKDKTHLKYNEYLTLADIPAEAFAYQLGTRSALEWVIDQYQVKTDKRSGIVNDPNDAARPRYLVELIGSVITVSLETLRIVEGLPETFL